LAQGFSIESGLRLRGVFGEKLQEEQVWFLALAAGGFKQAAQDAVVLQSFLRAGALDDFAQNKGSTQYMVRFLG
jgi:hypothetical protein